MQKLGFLMTEHPGATSAGTRIRTLYLLHVKDVRYSKQGSHLLSLTVAVTIAENEHQM